MSFPASKRKRSMRNWRPHSPSWRRNCPPVTRSRPAGTVEESAKGLRSIAVIFPMMIFLMLTILMVQLQSFQKMFLVISVAPLGLIGVVLALLPTHTPMGFVAILGIIALSGISSAIR